MRMIVREKNETSNFFYPTKKLKGTVVLSRYETHLPFPKTVTWPLKLHISRCFSDEMATGIFVIRRRRPGRTDVSVTVNRSIGVQKNVTEWDFRRFGDDAYTTFPPPVFLCPAHVLSSAAAAAATTTERRSDSPSQSVSHASPVRLIRRDTGAGERELVDRRRICKTPFFVSSVTFRTTKIGIRSFSGRRTGDKKKKPGLRKLAETKW